jgi:hypothetical protein
VAGDEQRKPSWRERRKAAKRAKAERTGDSPQKSAEREHEKSGSDVGQAAGNAGVIGTLAGM